MEGTGLQGLTSQVMAKGAIDPQTLPCPEPRLPSFPWHLPAHAGPQHCRVRRTTQESQGPRSRDLPRPTASLRQAHVLMVKNPPASAGDVKDTSSIPRSGIFPGGGNDSPLSVFLPGETHEQRSLEGYSPWGLKESDMTEHARPQVTQGGR